MWALLRSLLYKVCTQYLPGVPRQADLVPVLELYSLRVWRIWGKREAVRAPEHTTGRRKLGCGGGGRIYYYYDILCTSITAKRARRRNTRKRKLGSNIVGQAILAADRRLGVPGPLPLDDQGPVVGQLVV